MDSYEKFWINVWRIVGTTIVTIVLILSLYQNNQNVMWYESWNKCVAADGQPIENTVLGSDRRSFTCVRK